MIGEINHRNKQVAQEILEIQLPAYGIEAELMDFYEIPQLHETAIDIQNSGELFVGFQEEELMGVVSYKMVDGLVDIHRLIVNPAYFRRGIGKRLLEYLLKRYKGYEFIVSTGTANKPAIALYQAFGFQEQRKVEVAPGIECTVFGLRN
ncbi:GNAT family N-acetyltransferase [Microbacterium sp. APC 3898]|uniref:GNAT family N-acetyltransferase n=2 Tax=Planococcus TaxID=1372 RepID=A0ABT7ZKP2_9BACL|nr:MULTISPECIES: GNAT family N-acetyltransferase [Terrabacteria group]MBF6634067.1 GNAT family N-acetyltransferase [Planococcus sp. (in: firmicutes)]MBD8014823.1 GNAT family N-acetyltransferase [Planococcus wigleyi]MDN3427709.1 GNAT family N-acetyltransferase [Planococcus sp. APC 4016]MDN3437064.1 GNAT family N-acetyltransferase [Planococcus sp. APC 3900]MDN3499261.1 GNAT family N-acetyltransferase [Microbacterium sp. APC 3898]